MRFHQSVTFLEMDQLIPFAQVAEDLGYDGMYLSDHLFNPRTLESRYTYSQAPDGAPFWEKDVAWPDPMCLVSAMTAATVLPVAIRSTWPDTKAAMVALLSLVWTLGSVELVLDDGVVKLDSVVPTDASGDLTGGGSTEPSETRTTANTSSPTSARPATPLANTRFWLSAQLWSSTRRSSSRTGGS